jgi:hypothetical protein
VDTTTAHVTDPDLNRRSRSGLTTQPETEAGVPATVELIMLGAHDGSLTYRVLALPLPRGVEPDALARQALGPDLDHHAVLHSTSWRFDLDRLVVTYAVAPDPDPRAGGNLVADTVSRGPDACHPSGEPDQAEVAAHACRHLAFLMSTDPAVAKASRRRPELWRLISRFTPQVAGELQPAVAGIAEDDGPATRSGGGTIISVLSCGKRP